MNRDVLMELVLVRHAEPEWVREGLNIDNPPLTERGHEQAAITARALAGEKFDEILVSPLVRTRQTAGPLLAALGRDLVIDPWLEEIRNPVWHGTPVEKASAAYEAEKAKSSHERWTGIDGGEAVSSFVERINIGCSLFLEERGIVRERVDMPVWHLMPGFEPGRHICLVAHAGTNSVSICHLLGLQPTPWEWDRFVIGHASVTRIQLFELGDGVTFSLSRLSDNEHLPVELRTY